MAGSFRWLDRKAGDITLAWSDDQDEEVQAIIQKKMDQGVRFFHVPPFDPGATPMQINRIEDIQGREVRIADEDIAKLFTEGKVGVFTKARTALSNIVLGTATRITDAAQAVTSHTMAVRQPAGG